MNVEPREPAPPPDRNLLGRWAPWIVVLVLAGVAAVVITATREAGRDREAADLDDAFTYDVERYRSVPPEKIGYVQREAVPTGLVNATALAVAPDDTVVVGGDRRLLFYGPDNTPPTVRSLSRTPRALAVAPDGVLFVADRRTVDHGPLAEASERLIELPDERVRITSLVATRDALFVADAGTLVVWHVGRDGTIRSRIGERDKQRNVPGFVVPSPCFDVLLAPDGLLRIVDPGRHRITAFTLDGHHELSWGEASFDLEGFSGCCNPAHLAMLPDGSYVTSEKGIPRVKVYDARGRFVTAVVGPDGLDTETEPCDVAVDSEGRVLVLDPGRGTLRTFERRPDTKRGSADDE